MSFRKYGGTTFSAKHNNVNSNINNTNNLYVTTGVGQTTSYIDFYSDISCNILKANQGTFQYLTGGTGFIEYLTCPNITLKSATFSGIVYAEGGITGSTGSFQYLTGSTGSFQYLNVGTVSFDYLTVGTGSFDTLTSSTGSFQYLTGGTGSFQYLTGGTGSLQYLTGSTGSFQYLECDNIFANDGLTITQDVLTDLSYNSSAVLTLFSSPNTTTSNAIQFLLDGLAGINNPSTQQGDNCIIALNNDSSSTTLAVLNLMAQSGTSCGVRITDTDVTTTGTTINLTTSDTSSGTISLTSAFLIFLDGGPGPAGGVYINTVSGQTDGVTQIDGAYTYLNSSTTTISSTTTSITNDATISGLTVGKGGGSVDTNTAVGVSALVANTGGYQNTAVGLSTLAANTGGYQNTAVGDSALVANSNGYNNTAIGYQSGSENASALGQTITNCTYLGSNTGNFSSSTSYDSSTAIGVNAVISDSNQIVLGTDTEGVFLPGAYLQIGGTYSTPGSYSLDVPGTASIYGIEFILSPAGGNGEAAIQLYPNMYMDTENGNAFRFFNTSSPSAGFTFYPLSTTGVNVQIDNTATVYAVNFIASGSVTATYFTTTSDYRIKENVQPLDDTYTVDNLRPVTYTNTQAKKQDIGLIAHELQEEYPFLVHGIKDGDETQSVNYTGLIGILIKEIQDLKKTVSIMKTQIRDLQDNL
jgi:hypothetical protein